MTGDDDDLQYMRYMRHAALYMRHAALPKPPEHLTRAILTPHEHETSKNPPLWIVWGNKNDGDGWYIDSVCNIADVAEYNVAALLSEGHDCNVERIPANHRFASSVRYEAAKAAVRAKWARRTGD